MTIIGEDALSDLDKKYLHFSTRFEKELVGQGWTRRTIDETLDYGWKLLSILPRSELTRIDTAFVDQFYHMEEAKAV